MLPSHSPSTLPLSRQLKVTLHTLPSLPDSFAKARRSDPLTRLEAELLAVTPFIQAYREQQIRCVCRPESLSDFVADARSMIEVVEAAKYSGMVCHRTDLHEMRDVVLRQLERLFQATLDNHAVPEFASPPAQEDVVTSGHIVASTNRSTSPFSAALKMIPESKSAKRSLRFLTPLRSSRKSNYVPPLVRTPGPTKSVRRLVDAELKRDASQCEGLDGEDDAAITVIRL